MCSQGYDVVVWMIVKHHLKGGMELQCELEDAVTGEKNGGQLKQHIEARRPCNLERSGWLHKCGPVGGGVAWDRKDGLRETPAPKPALRTS